MPAPLSSPTLGQIARQIARRAGRAAIVLILLAAVSSRTSADPNVLFNPELDQVLLQSGWRIYFGSMLDWTGADSTGCAGSGAGQLESATTDVGTQWGEVGQCQPIDATWASTGLHAAFSYFSFDATMAYIQLFYFDDAACGLNGGNYLDFSTGSIGATGPGWHRVASSFPYAGVPATSQSVFVAVGAEAYQPTAMELLFDRAFFGRVPVVFTDGFETAGSLCRWSL